MLKITTVKLRLWKNAYRQGLKGDEKCPFTTLKSSSKASLCPIRSILDVEAHNGIFPASNTLLGVKFTLRT